MTARTNNDAETATKEIVTAAQQNVLNEHAEAIRILGKRTVHDIIEIGRRLAEVKKQIGRVSFLPWIDREFGWSEDTAERFMALHALQRQLPQVDRRRHQARARGGHPLRPTAEADEAPAAAGDEAPQSGRAAERHCAVAQRRSEHDLAPGVACGGVK